MKNSKLLKHLPLIYALYLTWIQTVGARWVANAIPIPFFPQLNTAMAYLPCGIFAVWLLILDVRKLREKKISWFSVAYYLFAVYYLALCVLRFATGGVVKDSVYYVIVLYGALAMVQLMLRSSIPTDRKTLCFDICIYSLVLCLYRMVWDMIRPYCGNNVMPINEIAMGAVLLFALVVVVHTLKTADSKGVRLLASAAVIGTVIVILALGSRIMFACLCVESTVLLAFLLIHKDSRKRALHYLTLVACGILVVAVLAVTNVGTVRYALYRATSIQLNKVESVPTTSMDEIQESAEQQIEKSDSLRKRLNDFGIAEFKKNPLFGTGNVYLDINDFGYPARVPVHNGVLQMLVSFGLIGTVLLIAMVLLWLWENRPNKRPVFSANMLNLLLLLCLYGALAMVQATSFDHMVLPSALLCAAVFLRGEGKPL